MKRCSTSVSFLGLVVESKTGARVGRTLLYWVLGPCTSPSRLRYHLYQFRTQQAVAVLHVWRPLELVAGKGI